MFATTLAAGLALPVVAGTPPLSEDVFFSDLPLVLSATRLWQSPLEAPAAVTIIDREAIEASGAIDVAELFRLVPGFQVSTITGNSFVATYHGQADPWPRRMEVMINGRSVYLPLMSTTFWDSLGLAIDDIERIEVVRGSNSPTYGSNSLLASVNILTREPFLQRGTYVELTAGSQSTGNGVLRHGGKLGTMDAVVTAQYRDDQGYDDLDDHTRLADLAFRGALQTNAQDNLFVELGMTTGSQGAEGLMYFAGDRVQPTDDRDLTSTYQNIKWTRTPNLGREHLVSFSHTRMYQDETFPLDIEPIYGIPRSFPFAYYEGTADRYDLTFQDSLHARDDLRLVWGLMGRYDRLESKLMLGDDDSVSDLSGHLFANAEWRAADKLLFNLGGHAEWHEGRDPYSSARIATNYLLTDHQSLRLSASRGFRMESLLENNMDFRVDLGPYGTYQFLESIGDLEPEKLTTYELGYHGEWSEQGLSADVRLYREELTRQATAAQNPFGYTSWIDEGGEWNTKGLELELHYRPTATTHALLAYAYADTDGRTATDVDADMAVIDWYDLSAGTPSNTLTLQLSHRFADDWLASLNYYHVDDFSWWSDAGEAVDDYDRVDLRLAKDFKLGTADAELSVVVQNLFDEALQEFNQYTLFERRGYIQFKIALP